MAKKQRRKANGAAAIVATLRRQQANALVQATAEGLSTC